MSTSRRPAGAAARRCARFAAVLVAASAAALTVAGPALADTPSGWEQAPAVSGLQFLFVLVLIPLGLAALITLLTALPGFARSGRGYQAGQAWSGDAEWFGGPAKGVGAADNLTPEQLESAEQSTGGTSARW